jgi:phage shock protein C
MYCNACGKAIADDARFCPYCGTVLGQMPAPKKLMRSRQRTIAGVCAGMAHYLDLDVSLVRVIWVVVTILSGIFPGVVVYALAWVIVPEEPLALPGMDTRAPVGNQ